MSYSSSTSSSSSVFDPSAGGRLTTPPASGWSWLNQGAAAVTTLSDGSIDLSITETAAAHSCRCYLRTMGATFTATTFVKNAGTGLVGHTAGLIAYRSSNGKLWSVDTGGHGTYSAAGTSSGSHAVTATRWTSTTVASAVQAGPRFHATGMNGFWLRLQYDGTNMVAAVNPYPDAPASTWETLLSEAATTFLGGAPTDYGIYISAYSTTSPLGIHRGRFHSFLESA